MKLVCYSGLCRCAWLCLLWDTYTCARDVPETTLEEKLSLPRKGLETVSVCRNVRLVEKRKSNSIVVKIIFYSVPFTCTHTVHFQNASDSSNFSLVLAGFGTRLQCRLPIERLGIFCDIWPSTAAITNLRKDMLQFKNNMH